MIKQSSMSELKDCLDLIHSQLITAFHMKNSKKEHVDKLNKWFDEVLTEIEYRNELASEIKELDSTNYLGLTK